MARASGIALERLDSRLVRSLPDDLKIHDLRVRKLATKMGDVEFNHSNRKLPRPTREGSLSPKMARRREERVLSDLKGPGATHVVKSVGSGYLPPHQTRVTNMSAEVRYAAGIDSTMAWS